MLPRTLGERDRERVQSRFVEPDVRLDVLVPAVIQEERNPRAVTRDILDQGVLHQRIDARPTEEVALEVVAEPENRGIGEGEAVLREEFLHLPGEDRPAIRSHGVVVEDQDVVEVVEEPFQEFVLKLREHRLEEEELDLIRLCIAGYHGEGKAPGDPVAVDLLVARRDLRFREVAVYHGVVPAHGRATLPEAEKAIQKMDRTGPLPGRRRAFSLCRHRGIPGSLNCRS